MKDTKTKQHGNKKFNITERKLGRHRAWGMYYRKENKIEIDPTQLSRHYLYVLVHELTHMAFPELNENGVIRASKIISKGVWQQGFRRMQK